MTEGPKMQKTIRAKNEKYHFEPNIQPNFHLVNFDVLIEKVKMECYATPWPLWRELMICLFSLKHGL